MLLNLRGGILISPVSTMEGVDVLARFRDKEYSAPIPVTGNLCSSWNIQLTSSCADSID